jgi:hypothetical protein
MFPWNYGFHWSAGTIIFLGAFYTVLIIVATTVATAMLRSFKALRHDRAEHIRWHSDFHDLPSGDRDCRHVISGEFDSRECPNAFDCRGCHTHAAMVAKQPVQNAPENEDLFGMEFPLDRYYHRGHTWAKVEEDGTVTVGLDDLGRRLLGTPDSVELPQPGTRLKANGTAFRLRRRGADVRLLSPVDGEVIEGGGPDSPWYLRVRPEPLDTRHLLRGAEVRPWLMREMERLQLALAVEGAGATLADGGTPVADIASAYPGADWDSVCGAMFLQG